MEHGNLAGVSDDVLDSLSRVLQLAETRHLYDLTRTAQPQPIRRCKRSDDQEARPTLQRFLDAITGTHLGAQPAHGFIAANHLGLALLAPLLADPVNQGNNARFVFLNPAARIDYPVWERGADDIVANLRTYAGRNPLDKGLTDLIGELVTRSDDFRIRWSASKARFHRSGVERIHHPEIGELEFAYEAMELLHSSGWTMFAYTTESESPTEESVKLLGSLTATRKTLEPTHSEHAKRACGSTRYANRVRAGNRERHFEETVPPRKGSHRSQQGEDAPRQQRSDDHHRKAPRCEPPKQCGAL
ncbi:transcriptional regulator [Rhodococcus sp. NPDC127530]|uniref:MmyB family transcriptional regulator n=1 Tax=unclassified Rhodococcus (in: high G+C Gram-positive bacteria) TaxID=192944 RepID=UPI003633BDDF